MGSFPIQTWTGCADEWIRDGDTGLLVPPEDSEIIEQAIRRALTDDKLVDKAQKINQLMVTERLDEKILKPKALNLYTTVFNDS